MNKHLKLFLSVVLCLLAVLSTTALSETTADSLLVFSEYDQRTLMLYFTYYSLLGGDYTVDSGAYLFLQEAKACLNHMDTLSPSDPDYPLSYTNAYMMATQATSLLSWDMENIRAASNKKHASDSVYTDQIESIQEWSVAMNLRLLFEYLGGRGGSISSQILDQSFGEYVNYKGDYSHMLLSDLIECVESNIIGSK